MIPKRVNVELSREDVRKDLEDIIDSMNTIRQESLRNPDGVLKETLNEYLHLSYRLGSVMQSIKTHEDILETALKNTTLDTLDYDPRYELLFNNENYTRSVDIALLAFVGDKVKSMDEKHHVAQAIKMIKSGSVNLEEKETIFDSVKPFHDIPKLKEITLSDKVLGDVYEITINQNEVKIQGHPRHIDEVIEKFSSYDNVKVITHKDYFDNKIKELKKFNSGKSSSRKKPYEFYDISRIEIIKESKFLENFMYSTSWILFPVYGMLPNSVKTYINKKTRDFDVYYVHSWQKSGGGIIAGLTLFAGVVNPDLGMSGWLKDLLSVIIADDLVTGIYASYKKNLAGSLFAKIPLLPLDRWAKDKIKPYREGRLTRESKADIDIENTENYVNIELEKPLEWSTENHFNFDEEVNEKLGHDATPYKARNMVAYTKSAPLGNYYKQNGVYFQKDARYIVTTIGKKEDLELQTVELLSEEKNIGNVLAKLEKNDVMYGRVRKYVDGELVEDLEGVSR